MMNKLKKIVTNGFIAYLSLVLVYVLFFFLVLYFKNVLHNIHDAYVITMNIILMLNLNIMSIVFINRFNTIKKKLNELNDKLSYE